MYFVSGRTSFFTITNVTGSLDKDSHSALDATQNHTLDLFSCGYHEFPRTFKISTNNRTYSFNADILQEISPAIKMKLSCEPDLTEFRISVSDSTNVMQKFEDLLTFFAVEISQEELPILLQIFSVLEIAFPLIDQSKSSIYRIEFAIRTFFNSKSSGNTFNFGETRRIIFFKDKSLNIRSNGKVYECNLSGACSSNIIKEIIESDPTCDTFQYNLTNDEDFSIIQQLFNFDTISINTHNMEFLEKVCKDLQIDCVLEKVEQFIQSYSNQLLVAESNDHLVEPINDLFESLYSIDTEGSEQVCHHILETEWIQDQSNIPEMISCILQVIRTNIRLHSYILDLIVLLNKELNNSNESNQFMPIFTKRLLSESKESFLSCAFLYKLQERQFITFDEISEFFKNSLFSRHLCSYPDTIQLIFQPEINERAKKFKQNTTFNSNFTFGNVSNRNISAIDFSNVNFNNDNKKKSRPKIYSSQYPELRKNFEPLNEILRLIIRDDYEKLQMKISQENIDINKNVQVISLIDSTDEDSGVSLINYAAENGSINCFKYLLVNHAEHSHDLLIHAVKGGNPEIIQISHSTMKKLIPDLTTKSSNESFPFNSQQKGPRQFGVYLNCLKVAIRMHRYSIIDWILTQIRDINEIKNLQSHLSSIYDTCTKNGNIQAIITLMNYDINIPEFIDNTKQQRFSFSSQNSLIQHGFYHFIQFLFQLTNQKQIDYSLINDPALVIESQNLKILNLFTNLPVNEILYLSIQTNLFSFVDYIMKHFHYYCEKIDYYNIYLSLVTNKSVPMFKLITSKYPLEQSKQYIESSQYLEILCKACEYSNYEAVVNFTNILLEIDKDTYFTSPFHEALNAFSSPICEFFIQKNVNLDLIDISKNVKLIMLDNGKFAPVLFEKADKSIQLRLFYFLLYQFISSSTLNEHHKQYIAKLLALNKSDQTNSMLKEISPNSPFVFSITQGNFYAFDAFIEYFGDQISDHIDQINFTLKYISENDYVGNSFDKIYRKLVELVNSGINITYLDDTFLTLAVQKSDLKLLQICLENLKDRQVFDEMSIKNPFVYAIAASNIDVFNAFIDYFGNNISKLTSQISCALQLLLEDFKFNPNTLIIMKRLFELTKFEMTIQYDKILQLTIEQSNIELLQLCLKHLKDQQIFNKLSIENPFIFAITRHNLEIVNIFIDYFGENISSKASQINYGLSLILEEYYNSRNNSNAGKNSFYQSDDFIIFMKRLSKFTYFDAQLTYRNDTFLTLAIKLSNLQLLQLYLENLKDLQIFDEISIENPFVFAIKARNLDVVNVFIDFFGKSISKQISQINYGLNLLLEDYSNDSKHNYQRNSNSGSDISIITKRLFEVTNFEITLNYDKFLKLAVKRSNEELLQLCLDNMKDQQIFEKQSIENPFVYAIKKHNLGIVNLFCDFFGDNISKQTSLINYGLNLLLKQGSQKLNLSFGFSTSSRDKSKAKLNFLAQFFSKTPSFDHDFLFKLYHLDEDARSFLFLQNYIDCRETKTGNTLLMAAILCNKPEIAISLAQCNGVDYGARNYDNQTALTLALNQIENRYTGNQKPYYIGNPKTFEDNYSQLIHILVKTIDRNEINRAFYFADDVVAQDLILHKDLNINSIRFIPQKNSISFGFGSNSSSPDYSTSLLYSIEKNYHIKSELILNHPQFNPQLSNANEAAFSVITNKDFQIFNRLLDFVDINILNSNGESLLLQCCTNNFTEGVQRILNDSKFDPVKVHFDTILLTVLQGYHENTYIQFEIMNTLMDYDSKHSQILHFDQLLPNGKSFFTQIQVRQDDNRQSPAATPMFTFGLADRSQETNESTSQYINFFLNKGVDPNKPDRFGVYPLQHAMQIKSLPFVQVLHYSGKIDYSIKINTNSIKNGTYLHLAAFSSDEITKQIIASKAFDLEVKDDLGHTPLMIVENEIRKAAIKREKSPCPNSTNGGLFAKNEENEVQKLSRISSLLTNNSKRRTFGGF